MRAADARIDAGRADLRTVEGDVFTDVVGAYMDVLRDEAIVSLNEGNVKVLETNLQGIGPSRKLYGHFAEAVRLRLGAECAWLVGEDGEILVVRGESGLCDAPRTAAFLRLGLNSAPWTSPTPFRAPI